MIQHMNLVFGAEGLKTGEGAFLMACANHTDPRGYVVAHMEQLADEAHMTLRSAQNQKAGLMERGLLASGERFSPKNGAQLANLLRLNLAKLSEMQRKKTDYGPTLVEELTFAATEENRRSDPPEKSAPPHADLAGRGGAESAPPPEKSAPPHADLAGGGGAESAPLLLPSSSPSSLSGVGEAREPLPSQEREKMPDGLNLPGQRHDAGEVEDVVSAYAAALRRPMTRATEQQIRSATAELLGEGFPAWWLCDRAKEMAPRGWTDLHKHAGRSTVSTKKLTGGASAPRPPRACCPDCGRPVAEDGELCASCSGTECSKPTCYRAANPENPDGLCSPCTDAADSYERRQLQRAAAS